MQIMFLIDCFFDNRKTSEEKEWSINLTTIYIMIDNSIQPAYNKCFRSY
jgi:hypothetical protein